MASNTTHMKRGIVAGVSTLALAGMGLMAPSAAFAAGEDAAPWDDAAPAPATGSLTIHKNGGDTTNVEYNGAELGHDEAPAAPENPPVHDAKYQLYKAGLNLGTKADWSVAAGIASAYENNPQITFNGAKTEATVANHKFVADGVVTTGADGSVKAENKAKDLYLVVETATGQVTGVYKNGIATGDEIDAGAVASFLVTVPMQPKGDPEAAAGWTYDVHVYTKANSGGGNGGGEVSKTGAANDAGQIVWTISAPIPMGLDAAKEFKSFRVIDYMPNNLELQDWAVSVKDKNGISADVVKKSDAGAADKVVYAGPTDLTADVNPTITAAGFKMHTWSLKFDAMKETMLTHQGGSVIVKITTEASSASDVAKLANSADFDGEIGGVVIPGGTPIPPQPPTDQFVNLTVKSVDDATTPNLVKESTFSVYAGTCASKGAKQEPSSLETAEAVKSLVVKANGNYCVVEEVTPSTTPGAWTRALDTDVTVAAADKTVNLVHSKTENTIPQLPITGANGRILLMAGGAAALMVAGGIYMTSRKRESEDA